MNILVLGATGLIGAEVTRRLADDGHQVAGLSRKPESSAIKMPHVRWIAADLATMLHSSDWGKVLSGQQVVVNCAGALQDGFSDDLTASQEKAMLALYEAARDRELGLVVQISAVTEGSSGELPFLSTKRNADMALVASGVPFVIFRPALVLGRNSHGGSALLRALAALPFVTPLIHADKPAAVIGLQDVATAVSRAVCGTVPAGSDLALDTGENLTLRELVLLHRRWLGLAPVKVFSLSPRLAWPVIKLADWAGRLGWRSPLRSTAMAVMSGGIATRQSRWKGMRLSSAAEILAAAPSGVQDRWFARLFLLKPIIIGILSLFWLVSGIVPLFSAQSAKGHFSAFLPGPLADIALIVTCVTDVALGLAVLFRPWAKASLVGMFGLTLIYLAAATLTEPGLWLDPLGPLIKVLPSLLLTLVALAILDER